MDHTQIADEVRRDLAAVQRREHERLVECGSSAQHAEAVQAFLDQRPAVFTR